jgi:hypothetical protein
MIDRKKLIIDGQIFQTDAKDRGMGRFTSRLMESLIREQNYYEQIEIVLTDHLPCSDSLRAELLAVFPSAQLTFCDLWISKQHALDAAFMHNRDVLTGHVQKSKEDCEVDYFIPALFQEPAVAVFPEGVRKLLLFHDIIPLLYYRRYRPVMDFGAYMKRFKYIFEADLIFTNSQTVADDLHTYLGIPFRRLIRIDGAAIISDKPLAKPDMSLPDKYILMPTSDDPRKNNLKAVLGFEEFINNTQSNYKLVITSKIFKREREYLQLFSKHLVFTGNLPEEQLDWLYKNCDAVLFVPEYEGLGLPVLEAVRFGKSVACSSISVFKEIDETAFNYCDYKNTSDIAEALKHAISSKPDVKKYEKVNKHYTWSRSATEMVKGLESYQEERPEINSRIAVLAPDPAFNGSSLESIVTAHAELSQYYEVDYYLQRSDDPKRIDRPDVIGNIANTHDISAFGVKTYSDYDAVIYHLGGAYHQAEILQRALYLPGFVIMHGAEMKNAYEQMVDQGLMTKERYVLEEQEGNFYKNLLYRQLGVLTHVNTAWGGWNHAQLPVSTGKITPYKSSTLLTIGVMGITDSQKSRDLFESISAQLKPGVCTVRVLSKGKFSSQTIDVLSSHENVSLHMELTDFEFRSEVNQMHVIVDFTQRNDGEERIEVLQAMCAGVVPVVRNIGWYEGLPDDASFKLESEEDLKNVLIKLAAMHQDGSLAEYAERARKYVEAASQATDYVGAITHMITSPVSGRALSVAQSIKQNKVTGIRQYLSVLRGGAQ